MTSAVLTPLEASFLDAEDANPSDHMHIGWVLIFDPAPLGEPSFDELRAHILSRLDALPRFRSRLSAPRVGRFVRPRWDSYPGLDIASQIRCARLPPSAGNSDLLKWLGDFYSQRLERNRPLWEIVMLTGLPCSQWALAVKVHHSMVDGLGGVIITSTLLDSKSGPSSSFRKSPGVTSGGHAGSYCGSKRQPYKKSFSCAARKLKTASAGLAVLAKLGHPDIELANTSLNVPIGPDRHLAVIEWSLAELKQIRTQLGGTVNDVVLAAVAGGLRRLLEVRKELPMPQFLKAMVPVNMRGPGEENTVGVRVSSFYVDLPIAEPNPFVRYRTIVEASHLLKLSEQAARAERLLDLAAVLPPFVQRTVERNLFPSNLHNLTITNIPGPSMPLHALGAPVRRILPLVPVSAGRPVGIAALSYAEAFTVTLNADPSSLPDLAILQQGITDSLAELSQQQ